MEEENIKKRIKNLAWTLPPCSRMDVRQGRPRGEGRVIVPGIVGEVYGFDGDIEMDAATVVLLV